MQICIFVRVYLYAESVRSLEAFAWPLYIYMLCICLTMHVQHMCMCTNVHVHVLDIVFVLALFVCSILLLPLSCYTLRNVCVTMKYVMHCIVIERFMCALPKTQQFVKSTCYYRDYAQYGIIHMYIHEKLICMCNCVITEQLNEQVHCTLFEPPFGQGRAV